MKAIAKHAALPASVGAALYPRPHAGGGEPGVRQSAHAHAPPRASAPRAAPRLGLGSDRRRPPRDDTCASKHGGDGGGGKQPPSWDEARADLLAAGAQGMDLLVLRLLLQNHKRMALAGARDMFELSSAAAWMQKNVAEI